MPDVRKILIIFVIGTLFAIFVQSLIEAVHPKPRYEDFCNMNEMSVPIPARPMYEKVNCSEPPMIECEREGYPSYKYDANGCAIEPYCNYCQRDLTITMGSYNLVVFIISSLLGLAAIAVGLYMPVHKNELNEWIATGFMLGGLISLFIGTARYYENMARFLRPAVLLGEIVLIIYLAYKKLKK